jgi:hypothetical protein
MRALHQQHTIILDDDRADADEREFGEFAVHEEVLSCQFSVLSCSLFCELRTEGSEANYNDRVKRRLYTLFHIRLLELRCYGS